MLIGTEAAISGISVRSTFGGLSDRFFLRCNSNRRLISKLTLSSFRHSRNTVSIVLILSCEATALGMTEVRSALAAARSMLAMLAMLALAVCAWLCVAPLSPAFAVASLSVIFMPRVVLGEDEEAPMDQSDLLSLVAKIDDWMDGTFWNTAIAQKAALAKAYELLEEIREQLKEEAAK